MHRVPAVLPGLALLVLVAGCGDDDSGAGERSTTTAATTRAAEPAVEGELNVFAAASLTDAFTAIGDDFEAANPGVSITFNFAASSALVTQISEGAPADVLASADTTNMDKLAEAGGVAAPPQEFATNKLAIVTPNDNPAGVTALADLANSDVKVALCAEQVPCGRFALEVLANAGLTVTPVSLEESVRGVLSKAELGEIDAGIVYVTDVRVAGDGVNGIDIPEDVNVVAHYPIASLTEAANGEAADALVAYVLSDAGQATLAEFGFGRP